MSCRSYYTFLSLDEAHPLGDKDQEQLQNFNFDTISNHKNGPDKGTTGA